MTLNAKYAYYIERAEFLDMTGGGNWSRNSARPSRRRRRTAGALWTGLLFILFAGLAAEIGRRLCVVSRHATF